MTNADMMLYCSSFPKVVEKILMGGNEGSNQKMWYAAWFAGDLPEIRKSEPSMCRSSCLGSYVSVSGSAQTRALLFLSNGQIYHHRCAHQNKMQRYPISYS